MKASKKLLSMLLLVAMCMSFMAVPAYAAGLDEGAVVGRVTADMMYSEPAEVEPAMEPATADDGLTEIQASAEGAAPAQTVSKVVVKKADGAEEGYDGLPAALAAASNGDVLTLNYNPSYGITLNVDKAVVILLNGHTIYVTVSAVNNAIYLNGATLRGGSVVITGNTVTVKENEPAPTYVAGIGGSGTLDGVSVSYTGPSRMLSGGITVYGGSYSADPTANLPAGFEAYEVDGRYKIREIEVEEPAEGEETAEEPVEGEELAEQPEETEQVAEQPAEQPAEGEQPVEQPAEGEQPAEQPVEGEQPAEQPVEGEQPAEQPVEGEQPAEQAEETVKDPSLLDKINDFLTGGTEEEVDPEAQTMEHNSDKESSVGNTTVTVSGAPEEADLEVTDLGLPADLEDKINEATEDEVKLIKALDINVSGAEIDTVVVTMQSDSFIGLTETPALWHLVGDTPVPVAIVSFDAATGTLVFNASSFSPYVVTVPDVMVPADKNDDVDMQVVLGPEGHVKAADGLQALVTAATTPNFTAILDVNTLWNLTNWGSVENLEIKLNGKTLSQNISVPAGKTLTITGDGTVSGNADVYGTLVMTGTINDTGYVATLSGSLIVEGSNVKIFALSFHNNSYVSINGGTYGPGTINAHAEAGGHITGGTFANEVPANLLATGYSCKQSGTSWVVYQSEEARVKTIDGSINFTRNGGNFIEFYKGTANAAQNYSFQFAVAPTDKLSAIDIVDAGGTVLESLAGMYTYDTGTGRVVISKNSVSPVLNNIPAGRVYIRFSFDTNSDGTVDIMIEVPLNVYPSVSYDPTTYVIDSFKPVVFTMTTYGGGFMADIPYYITVDLKDGENPYDKLVPATAYSISGANLTMNTSYLNNLTPGTHNFGFWYDIGGGKLVCLRCTVLVSVDYKVTQINAVNIYKDKNAADVNWYQYSGKNLSFTANGDVNKFTGVRVDGKTVPSGYYSWASAGTGSTNVQLYPSYIASLAMGKHTIELVFTDGVATAEFSVLSASSSPKTGDNNHIALWASLLVLSGAAVVALIPKKKKQ